MPLFGNGEGIAINPDVQSTFEHDYWEEFTRVNSAFTHEPEIQIRKVKKAPKVLVGNKRPINPSSNENFSNGLSLNANTVHEKSGPPSNSNISESSDTTLLKSSFYPALPGTPSDDDNEKDNNSPSSSDPSQSHKISVPDDSEEYVEYRSIAVQTEKYLYELEPELPYKCCFCCRSSTPCVVWIFVGISIVFFKMGAIVTGRWIYLSSSSFDEVTFYIAFSVCLGFATIYFRRGTKYHNPFDLLFLILTIPIMWALLTFTTTFLKTDMFFYVGSVIYSGFIIPYTAIGVYMIFQFWTRGKLFLKRVEGDKTLETKCRQLFFAQSLMVFDTQLSICAAIISMSRTVNDNNNIVWISSLVLSPFSIILSIASLIVGYFAIRKEVYKLAIVFTVLSLNQYGLVLGMLLKRPTSPGIFYVFISASIVLWSVFLFVVHSALLVLLWKWVIPNFNSGLKGPVNRTSQNNCIQCAKLTICR